MKYQHFLLVLLLGMMGIIACGQVSYLEVRSVAGRSTTVQGYLYRPSRNGPFPAVILVHGTGGLLLSHRSWASWLSGQGYVALVLDYKYTGSDLFGAAAYLMSLPFVQGDRVGAMGFSFGGLEVISAGIDQARAGDNTLKALIALYPNCQIGAYTGSTPLLMLLGGEDQWTPASACQRIAEDAKKEGRPVHYVVYPSAHHGFDRAEVRTPYHNPEGQGWIVYDPGAHTDAEKQIRKFLAENLR